MHIFAEVSWQQGIIQEIKPLGAENPKYSYLLPGFIDTHIHIESSMLTPVEFSRLAVHHGTVATISAPYCVPATPFETTGARLDTPQLESLFKSKKIPYLSEMMNYLGVLAKDPEVIAKLALANTI